MALRWAERGAGVEEGVVRIPGERRVVAVVVVVCAAAAAGVYCLAFL